jgi:hypothetical protein
MNPSSDESQIRELIQRLKHADTQNAPTWEDLLARPIRQPLRQPARRTQLAVACCFATTWLVVFWFIRSQQTTPILEPSAHIAEVVPPKAPAIVAPHESVAEIDFDRLWKVVEEHFTTTEIANSMGVPLWSSRTESLLAVNLNVSSEQE